ncbi:CAAX prenyl protease 2 isoform X2 [Scophthalmus maximus]|uniref:CAAX prenyl protease 2 isoform X2 n=1 Tax=Scophthalmus maximus TaxID=52904 RepID=UPI0015E1299E|nr:CAAX prenyl protease 2 isoform X2 [Scophthalmus maximus]
MAEEEGLSLNLPTEETEHSYGGFVAPEGVCWASVLSCLLLACSYVGSLYVWRSDLPRDHPTVIKRRFTSVLIVSGLSPLFVLAWREFTGVRTDSSLLALMGIRFEGLIPAVILPVLLTMVLFLGPLMQLAMDCPWSFMDGIRVASDPCFWTLCFSDMRWLRNQVVAPLTEELVFRACMLPMLVPCAGPSLAIFTCPLFFGVAFGFYSSLPPCDRVAALQAGNAVGNLPLGSVPVLLHCGVRGLHCLHLHQNRSPDGPGALPLLL